MNAVKYRVEHSMSAVFFIQNVLCICVHSISDSLEVKNSFKNPHTSWESPLSKISPFPKQKVPLSKTFSP